jgi:O-glycosyl hydrolase
MEMSISLRTLARGCALALLAAVLFVWPAAASAVDASVDANTQYQTIQGFGTCLYNPNMPDANSVYTNATLKQLYAQDLGCSILRVSVEPHVLMASGGTLVGPEVSLGSDLNANAAKFNWEQVRHRYYNDWATYLAANALETSRVKVFASVWSPPHWAKQATGTLINGQPTPVILNCDTCDTAGGTWKDTYFQYNARFMSGLVRSWDTYTGVPMYALSIQNEVTYENPFNSCTLAPNNDWARYANALKSVKDEFTAQGLTTKIMGPHFAHLGDNPANPYGLWVQTSLINAVKAHSDTGLKNFWQIYTNNYAAPKADQARMFHAYQLGSNNVPGAWAAWAGTVGGIAADGKETWNSEAGGHAATIDGALDLAHDANNQLVWANQSAWIYWQFCDGGTLSEHNLLGNNQITNPTASKKYVAFKQFSRYIRPGSKRVKLTFSNGTPTWGGSDQYDTQNSLIGSAYVHSTDGRVTLVLVNMGTSSQALNITVPTNPNVTSYQVFRTSSTESFTQLSNVNVSGGAVSFTIPARSIMTLTGVGTAPQVAAPTFSPPAGTYTSAQSVTISTTTSGASIRYTTDGSTPTSTTGTLYSSPVNIAVTTTLKAIAYKSGMTDSTVTTGVYTITGGGLPGGWTAADIGSPSPAGSTSYASGTWTVSGGGADIWGTSDQFHYAYQTISGDSTVIARVDSLTNTNGWAKAGVMIRDGTAANAKHASVVITPSNGVAFQRRTSTGGTSTSTQVTGITAPRWVRLVRSGNNFTASYSSNGTSWTTIGSAVTITLSAPRAGLAVTSHAQGTLCTSVMSNVSVSGGPTNPNSLFLNAGFENDLTSWTNTGASAITSDAASGAKAVITGTGQGGVNQQVSYTLGGTLNINVKAKLSGTVSGWAGLGVDFLDSGGAEISEVSYQVTATTYTVVGNASVTVPANTASLRFWTWKPGTTGNLLVDDVVVLRN